MQCDATMFVTGALDRVKPIYGIVHGETYTGLLQPVFRGPRLHRHDDSCGLLMEKSWPAKLIAPMTSVQIPLSPSLVLVLDVMATATVGGRRRLVITRFWLIV